MYRLLFLLVICCVSPRSSPAQLRIGINTKVEFASVDEGRAILTAVDEFVRRMSPFDRAARMKTDRDVSQVQYLAFVDRNVLNWTDAEKRVIVAALRGIQGELNALSIPLPKQVLLVKTTGEEEGGAAYTRANAIVVPQAYLASPATRIQKTISHELFHIMSRANPELREKLYAVIGFVKCSEVAFPPELKSRRITNPDAPRNDHCVRVTVGDSMRWAIPVLFSRSEKYDVQRGGEFFNYLQFQFLLVERNDDTSIVEPIQDGPVAKLVDIQETSGFFEQVGRNTNYIIHPEEILADNFALLVSRERSVTSPAVIDAMQRVLKEQISVQRDAAMKP